MSWALEAVEKAALERAQQELAVGEIYVLGLSVAQIHAFAWVFESTTGKAPQPLAAETIVRMLQERLK